MAGKADASPRGTDSLCAIQCRVSGIFKYSNFLILNVNALAGTAIPYLEVTKNLPLASASIRSRSWTYTIDVYLRKIDAEHNLINFGTFVVLFPQLIAGRL